MGPCLLLLASSLVAQGVDYGALASIPSPTSSRAPGDATGVLVRFSPGGGAQAAIVADLDAATTTIRVACYSFTAAPIAAALVRAKARGVAVFVVVDKSQPTARGGQFAALVAAGVPTRVDWRHPILHDKYIIIDDRIVFTGSYNFTESAERHNGENSLRLVGAAVAARYAADWTIHWAHASGPAEPIMAKSAPPRVLNVQPLIRYHGARDERRFMSSPIPPRWVCGSYGCDFVP